MTDEPNTLATFNALFPTDHADPNRRSRLSLFERWLNENEIKWAALLEDSEKVDNIVSDIDAHLSEYSLDKFNYLSED